MTRTITALSDRLLALVAPKATAKAATCSGSWVFCRCSSHYGIYQCCTYVNGKYSCGSCNHYVKYECA